MSFRKIIFFTLSLLFLAFYNSVASAQTENGEQIDISNPAVLLEEDEKIPEQVETGNPQDGDENVENKPVDIPDLIKEEGNKINLYFFFSQTCPHCAAESQYLRELSAEDTDVNVIPFEITSERAMYVVQNTSKIMKLDVRGVPVLVIGNWSYVGFKSSNETGKLIKNQINAYRQKERSDYIYEVLLKGGDKRLLTNKELSEISEIIKEQHEEFKDENGQENGSEDPVNGNGNGSEEKDPVIIKLPLIGDLDVSKFSLTVATVIFGLVDGFNPCAMWTLLFLISLLLDVKNTKRRWLLGLTFILTSGVIYFLLMAAWLNLFLFVGMIPVIRLGIAIFALSAGTYSVYKVLTEKNSGCSTENSEKKKAVFEKLKLITKKPNLLVSLIGIVLLAVAVNTVELLCSAGLPAIYTNMLSMNNLPTLQYYLYILLYILFFMMDDIVVFFIAMITMKIVGIETKYGKVSRIAGGIIMIIIGLLLILKPELLTFA